jgi:hypothetical protein
MTWGIFVSLAVLKSTQSHTSLHCDYPTSINDNNHPVIAEALPNIRIADIGHLVKNVIACLHQSLAVNYFGFTPRNTYQDQWPTIDMLRPSSSEDSLVSCENVLPFSNAGVKRV